MTKQGFTYIALILDRSGSMDRIRSDMQWALRHFVDEQKKVPGECQVALVQFDDVIENVFLHKPITEIEDIPLVPRNMTALYDAMGKTINLLGEHFARLSEDQRPEKVLVVTITDGLENASKEFSLLDVKNKVTHQQDKYGWQFTFIGANQDAVLTGSGLGVPTTSGLTYGANRYGTQVVGQSLSAATTRFRAASAGASYSYSEEEQKEAEATATSDAN